MSATEKFVGWLPALVGENWFSAWQIPLSEKSPAKNYRICFQYGCSNTLMAKLGLAVLYYI